VRQAIVPVREHPNAKDTDMANHSPKKVSPIWHSVPACSLRRTGAATARRTSWSSRPFSCC